MGDGGSLKGPDVGACSEAEAALRLRLLPGLGDRGAARLLRALGTARAVAEGGRRVEALVGTDVVRGLRSRGLAEEARALLRRAELRGAEVVGWADPRYPPPLRELPDPPPVLFLRGSLPLLEGRRVAIVGSRKATAAGRRSAERMARDLSRAGVTVLSGLALGVDGAAHRGALQGSGSTGAVLGAGLDRPYPRAHALLLERIAGEGLVVTEFPPGTSPRPHHFPRRNRILAALAEAVVVVEAGPGSGALITADHAQDLGRPILAVPGSVESEQSRGTNLLIRDGAALVMDAGDVLDHLEWGRPVPEPGLHRAPGEDLSPWEARLLHLVGAVPRPLEEILEASGLPPSRALVCLTGLELSDRVRRVPEGWVLGPGLP